MLKNSERFHAVSIAEE